MSISRRQIGLGAGALLLAGSAKAAETRMEPTGQETMGPFYPVRAPVSHDTDMTHYPGRSGRAQGQTIQLTGRVMDPRGNPLSASQMVVWQANAAGRYTNPVDTNTAPIDPNFLGVASFGVDSQGRYRIRTVKPGAYPEPTGTMRTPHIHFDVTNADYRLVAQMYFPGETLNRNDILLSTLSARHRDPTSVICRPAETSEPGVLAFTWDIVLIA